ACVDNSLARMLSRCALLAARNATIMAASDITALAQVARSPILSSAVDEGAGCCWSCVVELPFMVLFREDLVYHIYDVCDHIDMVVDAGTLHQFDEFFRIAQA